MILFYAESVSLLPAFDYDNALIYINCLACQVNRAFDPESIDLSLIPSCIEPKVLKLAFLAFLLDIWQHEKCEKILKVSQLEDM